MELNGEQVMIMIQKNIWQYVLEVWALHNQHLYHNANQLNLPDYCQAATTLYKQHDQLPPATQEALFWLPLDMILELPAPQLEQWVI